MGKKRQKEIKKAHTYMDLLLIAAGTFTSTLLLDIIIVAFKQHDEGHSEPNTAVYIFQHQCIVLSMKLMILVLKYINGGP